MQVEHTVSRLAKHKNRHAFVLSLVADPAALHVPFPSIFGRSELNLRVRTDHIYIETLFDVL